MRKLSVFLVLIAIHALAQGQTIDPPKDWFLRDPEQDQLQGVSVAKVYETLAGQPSRTVIVAVVDSGVDIEHEDLKSVIWINEDEIPGNNIDDDKNGYIDDVNGWNFIGGPTGICEVKKEI
jgi:cell wall-associated protease